jgi:hypothetical protein
LVMMREETMLYIPPPLFRSNGCDSMVILLLPSALPPVTVNPSNAVVAPSDMEITTW